MPVIKPVTKVIRRDVPAVPIPTTVDRDQKLFLQNVRERLEKLEQSIIALQAFTAEIEYDVNVIGDNQDDATTTEGERVEFREGLTPFNLLVETREPDNVIDASLTLVSVNTISRDMYIPEDYNLLYSSAAGLAGDFDITGDGYLLDVETGLRREVFVNETVPSLSHAALSFTSTVIDGETVYTLEVVTP